MGAFLDRCELEPLLQGLERLTEMHESIAALQGPGLLEEEQQDYRRPGHSWQLFGISPAARSLLNRVLVHQQTVLSEEYPPKEPHGMPTAPQHSHPLILVSPDVNPNANHHCPLLFSHIREQYQSIVEELMETDEPNNQTLSAFILRQASGAFLCRYRGCPRAAHGFHSSELRENHEESHRPRFQCAHATCGLFGTTFNSRAAMKKHAARYHDEDSTASVPNSLTRKPRGVHEDRNLFTFSNVKMKRKAEDSRSHEEHPESLQASSKRRTTLASSDSRHSASDLSIENSTPSTNAMPRLDRTMSDVYEDEWYSPRLSPRTRQWSPLQGYKGPITSTTDANAYAYYRPPSPLDLIPTNPVMPIAPPYPGYENAEVGPWFPEMPAPSPPAMSRQYPSTLKPRLKRKGKLEPPDHLPEFPASLPSMESSKFDPSHLYPGVPQQEQHQYQQNEVMSLSPNSDLPTWKDFSLQWAPITSEH